jgi:hypothetical protein
MIEVGESKVTIASEARRLELGGSPIEVAGKRERPR